MENNSGKKFESIGAVWLKKTEKGTWLNGKVNVNGHEMKIKLIKNKFYEEGGKKPYYVIAEDTYVKQDFGADENVPF